LFSANCPATVIGAVKVHAQPGHETRGQVKPARGQVSVAVVTVEHAVHSAVLETVAVKFLRPYLNKQVIAAELHVRTEIGDHEGNSHSLVEQLDVMFINLAGLAFSTPDQFLQARSQEAAFEVFFYLPVSILDLDLYMKQVLAAKRLIVALAAINGVREGIAV